MLIGVIQKTTLAECAAVLQSLDASLYDMLELRLDACRDLTLETLDRVARLPRPLPVLYTLRSPAESGAGGGASGGAGCTFVGNEASRLALLEDLMALQPDYLDVEASVPQERIRAIRAISPHTRLILSYHNFTAMPADLDAILHRMQAHAPGAIYKIAAHAETTLDALRMLVFCRTQSRAGVELVGIAMGEAGVTTRILAPVVHSGLCYCPVEEASAPGQLSARTLREVYRFSELNHDTAVYGLLGDPVEQSVGHLYHNQRNSAEKCNAVYVKWRVSQAQTGEALALLAALNVRGLSVTMPLKETVVPFMDAMDAEARAIGAVNTLKRDGHQWLATNTDGPGALRALAEPVEGKRLVVLGAGGAARALIHEASCRGAQVEVFNRSERPMPAAVRLRPFSALAALQDEGYDLLINALPFTCDMDFAQVPFLPARTVMDMSYGKPAGTAGDFVRLAREAGCRLVDGQDMFVRQAELQREFWQR